MKFILSFSIVFALTIHSFSQIFEYAMTESELAGAKINDILVVGDRVILGGGLKGEGSSIIIVFDTVGNFLNYQTFVPEKPERYYGYITDLRYDSIEQLIIANAYTGHACDVGGYTIYQWKINENLQKVGEFEFLITGEFSYGDPIARSSDSLTTITVKGKTLLYTHDLTKVDEVLLPETLSNPDVILFENHIIAFESYSRSSLHKIDMTGTVLEAKAIAPFTQIELFGGTLITSGTDGQIRIYNADSFEQMDSLSDPDYTETEFCKINDQQLEIAFHQENGPSKLGLYNLDLNLVQTIPFTPRDERKIQGAIDNKENLYQISSSYQINVTGPEVRGLIPVLRKINLKSESSPDKPDLTIVDVNIINPISSNHCFNFADNYFCSYPYDYFHYTFTIENRGDQTITNFGHYIGSVQLSYCGYYIQDYRYYADFTLAPGQQMTIADSVYSLGWVADAPKLNFYIVGPNHLITSDTGTVFTVEDISTSVSLTSSPERLVLYPNPAQDFISIGHRSRPSLLSNKVEIWSVTGQILQTTLAHENQININGLSPGAYLLRLIDGKNIFMGSFIKIE